MSNDLIKFCDELTLCFTEVMKNVTLNNTVVEACRKSEDVRYFQRKNM